jgi:DNA-binding SARP family transcriptional activator
MSNIREPLQITCLGRVQIVHNGELLSNTLLKKAQALLIYLALEPGRHERESLAALLWSDTPGDKARANLRTALNRLRQPLGHYLDTHHQAVTFASAAPYWLDVAYFEQGLGHPTTAEQRAALNLYQGDFLAGWNVPAAPLFEEWALLKREYLRGLALAGLAKVAEDALAADDYAQAISDLRRLLALDPWREAGHRALMRALATSGDRAAALAQYDACRRILAEELAVAPAPETVTLYQQIKEGRLAEAKTVQPLPWPAPPHNLPAETTPFVGRQEELTQIGGLLAPTNRACRLLTLFGPGGIGKTRLALQAARRLLPDFADGVFLVSLETVTSADLLATAIAAALNLRLTGQSPAETQLLAYLRERELLLVLDNFEHLLAGSDFLVTLLETAPGVKLFITSREALNLYEEWLLAVEGLSYPPEGSPADPAQFEAVFLFQQRAGQALLDFSLAQNEPAVAEICRLLLGMPLGIELAAAWVRTIACAEIARQIAANLATLTTSLRNVPPRHRSMVAVFDHSWELLRRPNASFCANCPFFAAASARMLPTRSPAPAGATFPAWPTKPCCALSPPAATISIPSFINTSPPSWPPTRPSRSKARPATPLTSPPSSVRQKPPSPTGRSRTP